MAKFKVLTEFVLNGITQKAESIIELDNKMASLKSIQANIEKVPDNTPIPGKEGSVLGSIVPGQPLTPETKEKLAKENIEQSNEAIRLAGEKTKADMDAGLGQPPVQVIADALKSKLENEEFQNTPPAPTDEGSNIPPANVPEQNNPPAIG